MITAKFTDDIFRNATISGTAPSTSYSLTTLKSGNPQARVLWGVTTVTITWTLGSSLEGKVLVIPVCNIAAGSSIMVLTNGAGLSLPVTVAAPQGNGVSRTLYFDFEALASQGARTSNVWHLVITSNTANVIFGGAVACYGAKRTTLFRKEKLSYKKTQAVEITANEYLSEYRVNLTTNQKILTLTALATTTAELQALEDWYDVDAGPEFPGLLKTNYSEFDALYGRWQPTFEANQIGDSRSYEVPFEFTELPKGKPVF